ncbi:SUMF1/EgtB/PvdO family nonheme iron enzyme [Aliifodinibius sp. S!AR15-10]|uniref:formylglycine-generating enzyme family protein n=1 Tax=Aliifodinibius sp. S!AR15-10 TaxID=2950437 RepID=UPI00287030B4|nr:SUMF1/EgtB/PvdO family nonheme iron enzyme [Aliifodinibius sp. S!AR15-10]
MKRLIFKIFLWVGVVFSFALSGQKKAGITSEFIPYSQKVPGSELGIELVPVTGGTFLMGSPVQETGREADEGPQHQVKVDSFWMGKYEIPWEVYDHFRTVHIDSFLVQETSSRGAAGINTDAISQPTPPFVDMSFGMGYEGHPAISMTHYAAVMFTKWLTVTTGTFYRLPTEAEWEYACRAGTGGAYHFGEDAALLDEYGWHYGNSDRSYKEIGQKKPNQWGLFDMHGNVAEWTADQYLEDYFGQLKGEVSENPWFRPDKLYPRAVRGGSWRDDPDELRCGNRRGSSPQWKMLDPQLPKSLWWHTSAPFVGFRIIRPLSSPSWEEMEKYWVEAMEDF